ncbi:MAG: hypothetical protein MJ105_03545 [Lachnospiraceae bacterium]|nr:hypothetical protein [Lachnospiraceae bacterium]
MRLEDDFDDEYDSFKKKGMRPSGSGMKMAGLISVFAIVGILILVVAANGKSGKKEKPKEPESTVLTASEQAALEQAALEKSVDELISGSTLRAEDLDIWDTPEKPSANEPQNKEEEQEKNEDSCAVEEELPPDQDGKHTLLIHADGSEEWVEINPGIKKNDYAQTGFVLKNGYLSYYENNTKISTLGVDISKTQDYVDFVELKRAGVDYVMISLGGRGYASGELYVDEYFADNMRRALDAGLDVGVYFFSTAISQDEAIEEAHFVSENLVPYEITYPVAYYTEAVSRQETRSDGLDKMSRTFIAQTFMNTLEQMGYYTVLYGSKEWLIKKYSLGSFQSTDMWLSQEGNLPDYPYEFVMWRYSKTGNVPGIAGPANMNICFIDYSKK